MPWKGTHVMPWMPGATRRPLTINFTNRKRTSTNALILHVDAGNASSLFGWFSNPAARASSHFFVTKAGGIEQYIDTDLISWCNRDGDKRAVTVETQGRDGEPWTEQQLAALAKIAVWVHLTHEVPVRLMENSKTTTAGIGWHRLGINGRFPALPSILAGREQRGGGELWSRSTGKTCPGSKRIEQMPRLLDLTRAELARQAGTLGSSATTTTKPSTTKPSTTTSTVRVLQIGSKGEDVRRLQDGLNRVFPSYSRLVEDGSFGRATEAVVKEFQRRVNLTADGVVGTRTREALNKNGVRF